MKRLAIALVVIGLLAVSQVTQAANLEEGWYVKFSSAALYGFDYALREEVSVGWTFTSGLGTYGPFTISQPNPLWPQRMISVATSVCGVPDKTGINLHGQPDSPFTFVSTRLDFMYETYYDATQVIASLFVQHANGETELIWNENRSGLHNRYATLITTILPSDIIYFNVSAVPEPSGVLFIIPATSLMWILRRKMR